MPTFPVRPQIDSREAVAVGDQSCGAVFESDHVGVNGPGNVNKYEVFSDKMVCQPCDSQVVLTCACCGGDYMLADFGQTESHVKFQTSPSAPSRQEYHEHMVTHTPYRN